jgi:hypothetical protein
LGQRIRLSAVKKVWIVLVVDFVPLEQPFTIAGSNSNQWESVVCNNAEMQTTARHDWFWL